MASRITTQGLEAMAEAGNALARLCLKQRRQLAEYIGTYGDSKSEKIIRDLQAENDRLRAENARLRSQ